jgi:hypothetical protein
VALNILVEYNKQRAMNLNKKSIKVLLGIYSTLFILGNLFWIGIELFLERDIYAILSIVSRILDSIAVVGISYSICFFNPRFWQGWFFVSIIYELILGELIESLALLQFNYLIIFQLFLLCFNLFFYYLLFLYAFKSFEIWYVEDN